MRPKNLSTRKGSLTVAAVVVPPEKVCRRRLFRLIMATLIVFRRPRARSVRRACASSLIVQKSAMKRIHLTFGVLVVIAFLLTGQYMDKYLNHLAGAPDGLRMLYRTRHIFILMAGLLNLGLGVYLTLHQQPWRRILQLTGSGLIIVASLLFIAAFFYEPKLTGLHTPLSHWGTYLMTAGTLLHLFGSAGKRHDTPR